MNNYIAAEEFLNQSEKAQKVLLDWWQPQIGDLFCDIDAYNINHIGCVLNNDKVECIILDKKYNYYIPLLQMHQLIQFIEDRLELLYYENDGRRIELDITHNNNFTRIEEGLGGNVKDIERVTWIIEDELCKKYDLLQVLWKVTVQIAEELWEG